MAKDKRILTIQDISCVGQCSLTVALPILSAAGIETAILPSAVLSTHTAGFKGYTFRDLTDDMPAIAAHWKSATFSPKAASGSSTRRWPTTASSIPDSTSLSPKR